MEWPASPEEYDQDRIVFIDALLTQIRTKIAVAGADALVTVEVGGEFGEALIRQLLTEAEVARVRFVDRSL